MKRTQRGFAVYGLIKDSRGVVLRVQQSSAMGGPYVWLFVDDVKQVYREEPAPHLNRAQAKRVIKALQRFVEAQP